MDTGYARSRKTCLAAIALTLALGFTGCTADGTTGSAEPADQTESSTSALMPGEPDFAGNENQPAEVNAVDLHFLGMMTPHHQQAVDMSDIVLAADGTSSETRDLARRIKDGQQREIDQMKDWADEWGQADMMAHHAPHVANGMLTPDQMDQLRALDGPDKERTFLELMHFHHEGAVEMTQDQIDRGGFAPLRELARQMMDIQTAEMREMEGMLGR